MVAAWLFLAVTMITVFGCITSSLSGIFKLFS
jgi:hypothetical protein